MALLTDTGEAALPGRPGAFARAGGALRGVLDAAPPPGLVLLGIVSVQLGAGLAKHLFTVLPPAAVVLLRLVTATLVLLLVARPRIAGSTRRDLLLVGAFGVALAGMNLAFYQALSQVPLGVAVTVEFVGPLAVAVAGSRRKLDALWVLLAAGGVVLLAKGGGDVPLGGIAWALLAATGWASYILLSSATGKRFSGTSGLTLAMGLGTVLAMPIGVAQGGATLLRPDLLALAAGVGLLSSAIPYALEMEALRKVPPKVFGILLSMEPAVAALVGLVVLGEMLEPRQWVAIGFVVIASVGATRAAKHDTTTPAT